MIGNEHFEGCLLGLALGDAIGFPCEFRTRAQILEAFGADGVTGPVGIHDPRWPLRPMIIGRGHPPGTVSDDTQMTIALAEGLLAADGGELDSRLESVSRAFVEWSTSPDNNRAPGGTCLRGCRNLAAGVPWRQAGVAASKGCGSAMRVAPIGLLYHRDRDELLRVARASSLPTHGHDAAVEGAAAAALLVAMALEHRSPADMLSALRQECAPRSPDFATCLEKLPALLEAPTEVALSTAGLGEGWVAEEAVISALWCVWRAEGDYRRAVLLAANTDGDSDSIACIAGSIAGANAGAAAIPADWLAVLEGRDRLVSLARRLSAGCAGHTGERLT